MEIKKLEIGRQLIHLLIGLIIILSYLIIEKSVLLLILLFILILAIISSIVSKNVKIPFIGFLLARFERDHNKNFPGKGFIFFMGGAMLVIKIFSQDIALMSLIVLTFGDSVSTLAGLFGGKYKRDPFNKYKSLYGTIAGILVSFLIGLLVVNAFESAIASIMGMVAEAISLKLGEQEADDNLIVPMVAGTALYLFRTL